MRPGTARISLRFATLAVASSFAGCEFVVAIPKSVDAMIVQALDDAPGAIAARGVTARFWLVTLAPWGLPGVRRASLAPGARDAPRRSLPLAHAPGLLPYRRREPPRRGLHAQSWARDSEPRQWSMAQRRIILRRRCAPCRARKSVALFSAPSVCLRVDWALVASLPDVTAAPRAGGPERAKT